MNPVGSYRKPGSSQDSNNSLSPIVAPSCSTSTNSSSDISSITNYHSNSTESYHSEGGSYHLDDHWSFWFYSKFSSWGPQLKPLYTVSTDVEFEKKLTGMVKPSSVKAKAQLYVMRRGISPDRLDQRNANGGCWAIFIPVDYPNGKELLNSLWYKLCRFMVNGKFPHDDLVCGAAVVMRNTQEKYRVRVDEQGVKKFDPCQLNRDRIELWTWEASECLIQVQIGQTMKALLDVTDLPLTYRNHSEAMHMRGEETITYTIN
eukprot:TRINITY_DN700_c0_g1_i12.p3 TRINITY_DN700_c0_g1~~TRINITY_DN700_c0_g1_i12.p3  ORF type:complete len:260 (-),score=16.87 TRINITY_DN700_c0_g1_i12:1605-2384(-)